MARDNVSQYILLGLLSIKPMSGYDIKYWISNGVGHFWCVSYGQIYPTLKKFVDDEWVIYTTDRAEGRPEKKVYTITDEGRNKLVEWLKEPIDFESSSYFSILTVKVYFGAAVEKEVTISHLETVLSTENKKLEGFLSAEKQVEVMREKALKNKDRTYPYRVSTLSQGILITRAQIEWCQETLNQLLNF